MQCFLALNIEWGSREDPSSNYVGRNAVARLPHLGLEEIMVEHLHPQELRPWLLLASNVVGSHG